MLQKKGQVILYRKGCFSKLQLMNVVADKKQNKLSLTAEVGKRSVLSG